MKILIIDDDQFLNNTLKKSLTNTGHYVEVLRKSREIEEQIDSVTDYDLVLLDLMMRKPQSIIVNPGEETGEAIYRKIRKIDKRKPVIIITGKDRKDIKTKFTDSYTAVLLKPFNSRFDDLYEAINNVA